MAGSSSLRIVTTSRLSVIQSGHYVHIRLQYLRYLSLSSTGTLRSDPSTNAMRCDCDDRNAEVNLQRFNCLLAVLHVKSVPKVP